MNEELKIIIRAVTQEAEKGLESVRKELDKIKETSKDTKQVDQALRAVGKGALAAVAGVAALTTAMVALGKSSLEFQKAQARLNAGFASMGMSAQQAGQTYKELYSYLGDVDQATEAANLLAQLTQDEAELADWTNILMGVYAKFPSSLPVESLAEAANHTAQLGEVQGTLADALEWSGVSVESFNNALANCNTTAEREQLIRSTLNSLYGGAATAYRQANQALLDYNASQVAVDQALADATAYTVPLMTALNNLSATLLTVLSPAFENICAVIIAFVQWVIAAIKAVGSFFGLFSDTSKAAKDASYSFGGFSTNLGLKETKDDLGGINDELKTIKKQTMGFDEMNIMSSQPAASGAGGGGGEIEIPEITVPAVNLGNLNVPGLADFEEKVAKIQEYLTPIAVAVGIIAAGLLAWKLAGFISELNDVLKIIGAVGLDMEKLAGYDSIMGTNAASWVGKLKTAGGLMLTIAGTAAAIAGFSNAWVNGVDWGNLALLIGGVAAALGGLYLAFGTLALTIGSFVAAVALFVLYFKDVQANGPTWQNTILLLGAAIATAIGLATAGLNVLASAIIAAGVALAAFTAALFLEEGAIMSVEEAQNALTEAKNRAIEAENGYINAVDAAESAMKRLEAAEEAAGMTGEELYKQVQEGTIDYKDMDAAQRELYKAYIDNEQKQKDLKASTEEFNAAKKAETLASYEHQLALAKESGSYDDFKKSVVAAFEAGELSAEEARDLIGKSMSEMSDDAQKTFMEDLPGSIKDGLEPSKYETTRKKIGDWFSKTWKDCKNAFKDVGEWFAGVGKKAGEAISSAFKTVLNWILQKIEDTVNAPFKMINGAIDILNKIPGVSISKLNLIDIPQLATGGITTGATMAMIGERGREAVLPLENNTEWMDTLANRISERQAMPSKIVLQVGEKELGWATINSINDITKQTGGLQLHIV